MDPPRVAPVHAGRRRAVYGIDAPRVPTFMGISGLVLLSIGLYQVRSGGSLAAAIIALYWALWMLASTASYLYTTRRGKFLVWNELLDGLHLNGSEHVLDLGCGRGAVLILAAKRLTTGKAIGMDLWSASDQSGNSQDAAYHNAELEGVAERVELHTGDIRALPFPDASFDVVLSSLAIHNIRSRSDRLRAVDEAVRVLRPGGKLLIADFRGTPEYEERLRARAMQEVTTRSLGPRFWYGGPWTATRLVSCSR